MECVCGFNFAKARLEDLDYDSFAVVNDKDYQRFLMAEVEVLRSKRAKARFRKILASSELVGSLLVCPECGSITLLKPGASQVERLQTAAALPGDSGPS